MMQKKTVGNIGGTMNNFFNSLKENLLKLGYIFREKKEVTDHGYEKNSLGNYLIERGVINPEQLQKALDYQCKNKDKKIGEILAEINILGEEETLEQLAAYLKVDIVKLDNLAFPLILQDFFNKSTMMKSLFVPFDLSGNILSVAVSDLDNEDLKNQIESLINRKGINYYITYYLALPSMIKRFIFNSYSKHPHKPQTSKYRKKFGEYLIEKEIISKGQLDEVLNLQKKFVNKRLGELLFEMKILQREQALRELAQHEGVEYESLEDKQPNHELISYFDYNYMIDNHFVPFGLENNIIKIAIFNIFDKELIEEIEMILQKNMLKVEFYISTKEAIDKMINNKS